MWLWFLLKPGGKRAKYITETKAYLKAFVTVAAIHKQTQNIHTFPHIFVEIRIHTRRLIQLIDKMRFWLKTARGEKEQKVEKKIN